MRVLLVHPRQVGLLGLQNFSLVEPLALEVVGACLEDHDVRLLDLRVVDELEGTLEEFQPDVVALACCLTTEVKETLRVAGRVKTWRADVVVLVGGHHPSLMPGDFDRPEVDVVVIGEGDNIIGELMGVLQNEQDPRRLPGLAVNGPDGQVLTEPRPLPPDLDALPLPARHLTAKQRGEYFWWTQRPHALVETARGCPHRCKFCSVWRFYRGKVRMKSAPRAVEEIAAAAEDDIFITDDNFLLNVPRAREIGRLLRERGIKKRYTIQARTDTIALYPDVLAELKEAGLISVFLGLESAAEEGLEALNKQNTVANNERALAILQDLGIGFTGNFIVDPQFDRRQFRGLARYVRERGLFNAAFSVLTPLPGTDLWDEVKDKLTTDDYERFDLWHAVLPTRLPLPQFYAEFAQLWRVAGEAASGRPRRRRIWRGFKQLISGKLRVSHLRQLRAAVRALETPQSYLR